MFDTVHEQLQLSVYQVARTPYRTLRAEIEHGHWAISHVQAGAVETLTRGERHRVPAGSVMIHPPLLPYAEYAAGPGTHEWMVFEAAVLPGMDLFRLHPVAPVVPMAEPAGFSHLFDRLLSAWEKPASPLRDLSVSALAAQLLCLILESWQAMGSPLRSEHLTTARDRFSGLIIYMSQNLGRKLSREDLAGFACLKPNSLDRAFRQVYGVAPMQMLRDLRLQRARHLLESADLTVAAIAELCGFEEVAYFTRVFRRQTGQTPGQHRAGVRAARAGYTFSENA